MNLVFAIFIGFIFIYLVIRYFLQFYAQYSKKMNAHIKNMGYKSYGQYKRKERKNEKRRQLEQIIELENKKYDSKKRR